MVVSGSNLFWGDSIERLRESTGPGLVTSLWSLEKLPVPDTAQGSHILARARLHARLASWHPLCVCSPNPLFITGKDHYTDHQSRDSQRHNSVQRLPLTTLAHDQLPIPTTAPRLAQGWHSSPVLPYLSHVTDDYCHDDPIDGHGLAENDAVGERQSLSTVSQSVSPVSQGKDPTPRSPYTSCPASQTPPHPYGKLPTAFLSN